MFLTPVCVFAQIYGVIMFLYVLYACIYIYNKYIYNGFAMKMCIDAVADFAHVRVCVVIII